MKYRIVYNVYPPTKIYSVNPDEELFFDELYARLDESENSHIVLHRFSNGTIEPYYKTYPVGKVKLQGRKHYMQILKSLYKYDEIDGTVQDFIDRLDDMILYLRKRCK